MSHDAQGPWLTSRRLGIFFAVAEEGSLTRAAARLALSQPAVSTRGFADWIAKMFTHVADVSPNS